VPFRPEGGYSLPGLVLTFGLPVLTGIALGFAVSFVRQKFYLMLIFPLLIGLGVGVAGILAVKKGKVRNPFLAGLAGFLGGCVAMVGMHYFDYQRCLDQFEEKFPGFRAQAAQHFSFPKFVDLRAQNGVQLDRGRGGNRGGLNLGYYGSYVYWAVEILIVAGLAGFMMRASASEPFCPSCRTWKKTRPLGRLNIPRDLARQVIAAGEVVRLAGHDLAPGAGPLMMEVAVCPNCGPGEPVDVTFKEVTRNAKGQEKSVTLTHVTYPGESLPVLESLFEVSESPASGGQPPASGGRQPPDGFLPSGG
jgi:hypothetical protein